MRVAVVVCLVAVVVVGVGVGGSAAREGVQDSNSGWTLPPDAESRKSPLTMDAKVIAAGQTVFKNNCRRCHGPAGLGDGPDADPDAREKMDLTNPKAADRNSDGVIFYKVMNGRRRPKMPAFNEELTEQQVWSVVAYVQTLRKK